MNSHDLLAGERFIYTGTSLMRLTCKILYYNPITQTVSDNDKQERLETFDLDSYGDYWFYLYNPAFQKIQISYRECHLFEDIKLELINSGFKAKNDAGYMMEFLERRAGR